MNPKIRVIIPARLASSRLPRKALLDIAGKPMLQHVYELVQKSGVDSIVIATDSAEIEQKAKAFGADVCMTASHHSSGTERIGEVIQQRRYNDQDIIVNVQCDVPLLSPILIRQVADSLLERSDAVMATLYEPFQDKADIFNPSYVKVVLDAKGYAMTFSRAPIPYFRDGFVMNSMQQSTVPPDFQYLHHIGLYAYRAGFVQQYLSWPESQIENIECLEQLRVLYYGKKIYLTQAKAKPGQGVDTPEDLEKVRILIGDNHRLN
jgi:3-deoxy-manno-octulosonate cytidylyltransferase (CMP-KDO synthetase)